MLAEDAQHFGELIDTGAAAAKLSGHAGLDQARFLQRGKILGDELVLVGGGGGGGALGEDGAELAGDLDGAAVRCRIDGACCVAAHGDPSIHWDIRR